MKENETKTFKYEIKNETNRIKQLYPLPKHYIPRRFIFIALSFTSLIVCNITRIVLSVAVISMKHQFNWNDSFKGFLLSSFAIGYLCTQIPSQKLCDSFGGKKVFLFGLTISICTLFLVPITAHNKVLLIICRFACGLFQGVAYSTINWMISRWVPLCQRSTSASLIWSGIFVGTILGDFATPVILEYYSWEISFYIIGGCCLVWSLLWLIFISDYPKDITIGIHPNELLFINHGKDSDLKIELNDTTSNENSNQLAIDKDNSRDKLESSSDNSISTSKDESIDSGIDINNSTNTIISDSNENLNNLAHNSNSNSNSNNNNISNVSGSNNSYFYVIRKFLKSRSIITLLYLNVTCNWGYFLLLYWYPTYLSKQLGYSTGLKFACFNSLPFFIACLNSIIFGYVSDKLESRGVRKVIIRKFLGSFVYSLPAIFLFLLAKVPSDNIGKIAFITIAICANGFSNVGYQMITLDVSTVKTASIAMGIGNLGSAVPSMLGPLVGGYILDSFNGDWNYIFIISGSTYIIGTIVWVSLMKTDVII